jgi:hypothetical protein
VVNRKPTFLLGTYQRRQDVPKSRLLLDCEASHLLLIALRDGLRINGITYGVTWYGLCS